MMSDIELKPCPFCGTDLSKFPEVMTVLPVRSEEYLMAEMQHQKIIGSDKGYAVNCIKCGAVGARGMTKEEAVKKWNKRASEKHGVWKMIFDNVVCSECGRSPADSLVKGAFCAYCGAKMKEEKRGLIRR